MNVDDKDLQIGFTDSLQICDTNENPLDNISEASRDKSLTAIDKYIDLRVKPKFSTNKTTLK